jgi:branched-subunit amino acid ABC-type transport system permease component
VLYVQLAVAGLIAGGAYALASVGIVTIYKGTQIINFAQGALGMVGTYIYATRLAAGDSQAASICLGLLTSLVLGLLCYFLIMLPLGRRSAISRMVATFGILLILQGVAELKWGALVLAVPPILSGPAWHLGDIAVERQAVLSLTVAIVLTSAIAVYFVRTKIGRQTEAASLSPDGASRLGYDVRVLGALCWAFGSLAAGTAGILIVPTLGLSQTALTLVVISAMVGALVGSFSRLWLALAGSLIVGIVASEIEGTVASLNGLDQAVPLIAVILLLLMRSRGAASYAAEKATLPRVSRASLSWPGLLFAAVLAAVALLTFDGLWQALLVQAAGQAMVALSLVLVFGFLGSISVMQWSIAGVGAFVAAYLQVGHGWPLVPAVAVAAVVAAVLAMLTALPLIRFRGTIVVIVTLSMSITIEALVLSNFKQGSGYSLPTPEIGGVSISGRALSAASLALVALTAFGLYWFKSSRSGKQVLAIRSSERAALAVGIPTYRLKLIVFAAAGLVAAIGGCLWAYSTGVVEADTFDPITSLTLLAFVYMNGAGVISGGLAAGFAIGLGPEFFTDVLNVNGVGWFSLLGGIGLITTLLYRPDGAMSEFKLPPALTRLTKGGGVVGDRAGVEARV